MKKKNYSSYIFDFFKLQVFLPKFRLIIALDKLVKISSDQKELTFLPSFYA
jgi:hypothetical protein